ncbi:hypothetical protein KAU32_00310 [bacterium]|nr:hypothetical protein [bacterium]
MKLDIVNLGVLTDYIFNKHKFTRNIYENFKAHFHQYKNIYEIQRQVIGDVDSLLDNLDSEAVSFGVNSDKIIEDSENLSTKLASLLKMFLGISQYNQVINFVTENIEATNNKLEDLFTNFKNNEENLNRMANSVRQLALNTIIKSSKGQEQRKTLSIIAENVTANSEDIIRVISQFGEEMSNYSKLSQKISTENEKFNALSAKIAENIVKVNADVDLYKEYYKKISDITPKLKGSRGIIHSILKFLMDIKNNLNSMIEDLNESNELNSLKFDEFNAVFEELEDSLVEIKEVSALGNYFLHDKEINKTLKLQGSFKDFDPFSVKNLKDAVFNKLLFFHLVTQKGVRSVPQLLDKWEYINTKNFLMLYLRGDILFSDGSPLDGEDVKFSIDTFIKTTEHPSFSVIEGYDDFISGKTESLSGVTFIDQMTLLIRLKKSYPDFIANFSRLSLPIIKKDSYPGDYTKITSGPYYKKGGTLLTNPYFPFTNNRLNKIELDWDDNPDIGWEKELNKEMLTGADIFILNDTLDEDSRRGVVSLLLKEFSPYNLNAKKKTEIDVKGEVKFPSELIIKDELDDGEIKKIIEEIFSESEVKIKWVKRKGAKYNMRIFRFYTPDDPLSDLINRVTAESSDLIKAKVKMLGHFGRVQSERLLMDNFHFFPFRRVREKFHLSKDISLCGNDITSFENILKKGEIDIDPADGRFRHFFNLFRSFLKQFRIKLDNGLNQLDYLGQKYSSDYESLMGEYDFFQGAMEKFSFLIREFEKLEKIIKPVHNVDISNITMNSMIFNSLQLSLNSFFANLRMYENFLTNFEGKLSLIYVSLNKINDLSYFSSMEAEKSTDIKDDIMTIIRQIRKITKENTRSNLDIEILLKQSSLAIVNLKVYIKKALSNIDDVFGLLKQINDVSTQILSNNEEINVSFNSILENIGNMKSFSEISLSKINELLSIYKENEKYFTRVLSFNEMNRNHFQFLDQLYSQDLITDFLKLELKGPAKNVRKLRELNLHYTNLPFTWDPRMVTDNTTMKYLNFLFSGLFHLSPTLFLSPHLIKNWEIKEHGMAAEFTLRDNIKFSNGEEITSKDIIYTFYRIFDRKEPSPNLFLFENILGARAYEQGKTDFIDGIRYISEKRFAFRFENIYTPFYLNLGTLTSSILWKGNTYADYEIPVGVGPFVVESFNEAEVILKKNEEYFIEFDNFDRVIIKVVHDEKITQAKFLEGKLDIHVPSSQFVSLMNNKKIEVDGSVYSLPQLDVRYLGINIPSRPELTVKEIRHAIGHAINRRELMEEISGNMSIVANGVLPPGVLGHQENEDYCHFDPERSRELLLKAGLKNGIKMPLILSFSDSDIESKKAAMIKKYLDAVNIHVELNPLPWHDFIEACKVGKVQLFLLGWIADNGDPDNFYYPLFHSRNIGISGNYFGFKDEKVDSMLDSAMSVINKVNRAEIYQKVENQIIEDMPAVFLTHSLHYTITNKNLRGFKPHPLDLLNIVNWWKA